MGMQLPEGISFCCTSDRLLFLDVRRDRYFCLAEATEQSFLRIQQGMGSLADAELLVAAGIVENVAGDVLPAPCPTGPEPAASLLDGTLGRAGIRAITQAFVELSRTRWRLRRHGLAATLGTIPSADAGRIDRFDDTASRVIAGFAATTLLSSAHDQCLVRSIAITRRLRRLRQPAELVIGVRLQPFRAHAWVRNGDMVMNDHIEVVREFTPIWIMG
jgi:hypothetical protein